MALRAWAEARLNQIWYGKSRSLAAEALVPIYRALRWLDQLGKPSKAVTGRSLGLPPIVLIGNLTIGGSGKTPLVMHLVHQAQAAGLKPGVITRGYGGRAVRKNSVLLLDANNALNWQDCGDEALLIHQRCHCPVAICTDRIAAARALSQCCDVLFCDDGLQNLTIPRELEVLVIDGTRRFGNEQLLPAGPLREALPPKLNEHFPWRVNNGGVNVQAGEISMHLLCELAHNTLTQESRALGSFQCVHAVAGIGNPERFYRMLEGMGIHCLAVPVGDHQVLADAVWQRLLNSGLPILMTEKDALKYGAAANLWSVPVNAQLTPPLWPSLAAALNYGADQTADRAH